MLSPTGSVDAKNVSFTSEDESILLTTFPIAFIETLSRSITGDTFVFSVDKVIGINKDFAPDNSFVSLIGDATILLVSKLKFSFKGIAVAVVVVEKDVSEPLGLVPLVDLIAAETTVSGNSNASNTAVGFNSTAGNTTGSGNTAIGSLSLQTLRDGSFNIAIGHGAGSHIPKDHSYRFYLGVDPIDSGYDCDSMINTSGAVPLMYGDLQERILAVATQSIHPHGTLQVSGDITPSHSGEFNLGNSSRPWSSMNEVIHFSGSPVKVGVGTSTPSGDQGLLTVAGNIVPDINGSRSIGWSDGTVNGRKLLWDGYFNDIVVSGNAKINDLQYHTINECLYDCKTLHLATSGVCDDAGLGFHNDAVCGYLNDESVDGGGFVVHSSGYDYQRDYRFLFRNSDPTIKCLEIDNHFSRSRWQSNISIEISSGCHFQGNRVLADHGLSLVKQSGCYGIFTRSEHPSGDKTYISREEHIGAYPTFKDVNFIANSGTHLGSDSNPSGYDYSVMYGTVDSGVKITQEFSSRIKTTSGKRGFSIVYHDELDA